VAKDKKSFVLRIDKEILDAVERWAADEFRSTNGQLEWLIVNALKKDKRYKKPTGTKEEDQKDKL